MINPIHTSALQGFNPKLIDGLLMWVEANSIDQADDSTVSTWVDLSESGNNITAGGGSPIVKTNVLNGKKFVRFNGTTDYMNIPLGVAEGGTMFIVGKRGYYKEPFAQIQGVSNRGMVGYAGSYEMYNNYRRNGSTVSAGFTNTDFGIISAYDGRASVAQIGSYFRLGYGTPAYQYLTGDIAEIIFYSQELSVSDIEKIEKYLSIKYGITV